MKYNETTQTYEPGVIYELRCYINDEWHAFYVGETTNKERRLAQHRSNTVQGETAVYEFIREALIPNKIIWDMFEIETYGTEGPTDREDECIMNLLYDNVKLKNMKKGNANWMQERERTATDMRKRGISSYRKYRDVLSLEEKQAKWLADRQGGNQSRASTLPDKWAQQDMTTVQSIDTLNSVRKAGLKNGSVAELNRIRLRQEEIWHTTGKLIHEQDPKDWK